MAKKEGEPIPRGRYYFGLCFLVAYHSVVRASLTATSLLNKDFRTARSFHREYFRRLLKETWDREGITVARKER